MRILRHLGTFLFSALLHLVMAAPLVVSFEATPPPVEIPGDGGNADTPSGLGAVEPSVDTPAPPAPVSVSLYVPPANPVAAAATPSASSSSAPVSSSRASAPAGPRANPNSGTAGGASGPTRIGSSSGPVNPDGDGTPVKRTRGRRDPCEKTDEIVKTGEAEWTLSREMVDYYASHLNEAGKHANVAVHKGLDGKRDGATLYLSRCSLMKQGGMRNGDVVHTINGRKVQTVPQALSTYLAVRDETWVEVTFSRQGEKRTHRYKLR